MSDFTENIRRAYELYLLGEKKEAFGLLIPGTKHHYYLSIIDALKRERHAISKETKDLILHFKNNFEDEDVNRIKLQELFLRYDGAKNDEERNEIINEIDTTFIYGYYNHTKPADVQRKKDSKSKSSAKETQVFDQEKHYDEEDILKDVYKNNGSLYSVVNTMFNTFDQKFKTDKYFTPDQYLYDRFTLQQLEYLGEKLEKVKKDTHYVGKVFEKKFHFELDPENKDSFTLEQRRDQLIAMYEASKERPQSFKSALLLEILENGIKLDIYDKNYFIEYLKHPLKTWHMNKNIQRRGDIHEHVWNQYMSSLQNRQGGRMDSGLDKKLYRKYLEQFYNSSGNLDDFKEYFDQDFLNDLLEEFEFLAGKEIRKEKIDAGKFERLTNQVLIDLLECNKSVFKMEDRVKLVAEIKNVQTLHVKIFEFNSENYYRKNLAPFRTDVNLDGLVTAHEEKYEFEEPSQRKFRQVFEFPQLDNRLGLFVIEFISNGYSSRAVIKKGSLSLIYKSTVAGQVAYILDENKQICTGENTGMWYKNQYFKADPEKGGRIVIPYEKKESSDKTILINDGFAQLTEFRRMSENYSFNVAYLVNHESLLMGKEAEILLKPCLKVNDRKCNLNVLKNTKVTLTTTSFIDNLPVTKVFDNLEVSNDKEISIKFQVPPNLQSVFIQIDSEVRNISKGTIENLTHSHSIQMDTKSNSLSFYESYFRKLKGNYYYYILGKNGEPLSDVNVSFTFYHSFYTTKDVSVTLNSDDDGKINLGPLKDINSVYANFEGPNGSCSSNYTINNQTEKVSLPDSLNILEDEEVQLPFISSKEFSRDTITLTRFTSTFKVIEDCFDKLSFSHEEGYQYGKVTISGLERGHYSLNFLLTGHVINIRVHKGVYWETDSFILKDHSLVEKRDRTHIIRIKDVKLEEEKEQHRLSFSLEGYGKHVKAHVHAFTFLPADLNTNYNNVDSAIKDWSSLDIFPFAKWENIYLSNRKLGDEFRYVFDRKFLKRFMGNTLDRPQLLLNRHKLRETQFDKEVVNTGNQYQHKEEAKQEIQRRTQAIAPSAYSLASNMAPMMQQQRMQQPMYQQDLDIMCQNIAPMGYSEGLNVNYASSNAYAYGGGYGASLKSFHNFLNNHGCIISNLIPNENGHIECSFDAQKYSTIVILATDDNTVSQSVVDVDSALDKIEKRDLSLSTPLDPNKHYNEMRNTELLKKGDSHIIEDITSTDYLMIDSLEKVKQVQTEIQRATGTHASSDLLFLTKWHTYSLEEKNKKYSQFMCHEVNLFLYFKDPEYFKSVVRPFIANKMEKTFIDQWLLDDKESVLKYKDLEYTDRLNTLEKCLLISTLAKDNKEEAQALADKIKLLSDQKEVRIEVRNRIFDTVINLNMSQDKPVILDQHMQAEAMVRDVGEIFQDNLNVLLEQSEMRFGGADRTTARAMNANINLMARGGGMERAAPMKKKMAKAMMKSIKNAYEEDESYRSDDDYEELRQKTKIQFQEAEVASEYCETHYYKNPNVLNPTKVEENPFWVDFAKHIVETGSVNDFMSANFILATSGETQIIAVLTVLSLPSASQHQTLRSHGGKGINITADENLILFKKEIKEAEADLDTNLLVIHRFFDPNNRNSEAKIKEFLVNKVYGCETIITNVSTKSQDFQILWQIPEGSLPLQNTNYQKSENKKLGSYSTTTFQYYFYFPHPGNFIQFPSNITIGDKVVAVANECKFEVVEERKEVSNETFRDILLSGNNDSIIEFLETANLYKGEKGFNFSDMLWTLKDKDFFIRVTDTLRRRKIYDDLTWKYGFFHKDPRTIRESLMKNNYLLSQTGTFFESDLIKCSPDTSNFRHLDYFPMINARAHKLGDNANPGILNRQFRDTYHKLLKTLVEKPKLNDSDLLNLTYYFLLQDRINEAIEIFEKIDSKYFSTTHTLQMQYDYMCAYLDFFIGSESGFKIAKVLSQKYSDYPVLSWKVLFTEILDQLEEFECGIDYDEDIDNEDETKRKANLKKSINLEPTLHCELEGKNIKVEYNNIPKLLVKYYVIDPEVLFSRAPFLNQNTEDFAYVKPMETQEITLDKKLKSDQFEIHEKLQNNNLVIEVTGEGKQSFLTYFSTSLRVVINENFGELKVTDKEDKPLAKVYVKAFSKERGGEIKFFKDGYTDIRGKFEYAQINSKKLGTVEKFAILVMSDEHGSITREAKVPTNVVKEVEQGLDFLQPSQINKIRHQQNRAVNRANRKCM